MRVISAARWLTCWLISSALPTKLRATSALTPSSVRSTSLAFCLSTLLTPVDTAVSARSTSPAFCLSTVVTPVDAAVELALDLGGVLLEHAIRSSAGASRRC